MQMTRCTMGLARDFTMRRDLVARNERIFFSDLTDTDLARLDLSGRHFFGCILTGCDLRGATLAGARFENCFVGADEARFPRLDGASVVDLSLENCDFVLSSTPARWLPHRSGWDLESAEAMRRALQGDFEPLFQALRQRLSSARNREVLLGSPASSAMLALCATCLRAPDWEHRLRALSLLSDVLLLASRAMGVMRDAYLTVLLYRLGDAADTVYYPALELVETFEPDEPLLRHLFGRIDSPEPAERSEALRGAARLLSRYAYDALLPLDGLERLLSEPRQPPGILREALTLINARLQALALDKEEARARWTPALRRLLVHGDESVRLEALRVVSHFHDWEGRPQVREMLSDASEALRHEAFMTLYRITPEEELLELLKAHPPGESARARILAHQAYLLERGWSNSLISDTELRPLLTSADPKARLDGLYYASFIGDSQHLPELMASLTHEDPAIRTAALRAIEALVEPPDEAALRVLENEPDETVRAQLGRTLAAIARKRG